MSRPTGWRSYDEVAETYENVAAVVQWLPGRHRMGPSAVADGENQEAEADAIVESVRDDLGLPSEAPEKVARREEHLRP